MVTSYFGVVLINGIDNIRPPEYALDKNSAEDLLLTENHIKIVHYPDCQQLIVWLPEYHDIYEDISIKDILSGQNIYFKKISGIVSGSIQIIIDTLFIYPGEFVITISKIDGLQHNVTFVKYKEGVIPEVPDKTPVEAVDLDKPPIEYRDGLGNILPNEDLLLREKLIGYMVKKFSRKLLFDGNGRSGSVTYLEGDKKVSFESEIGGGDCIFFIHIPDEENWLNKTGFELNERNDILQFVAENTLRIQISSSDAYYLIGERDILFIRK